MTSLSDPPRIWFASDHHHGHQSVIKYNSRPFTSLGEMDEKLIEAHNKVVRAGDMVFFLGDFSWYQPEHTEYIMSQYKGNKFLVRGNHDHFKRIKAIKSAEVITATPKELRIGSDDIVLSHFPIMSWHRQAKGAYHLHGHCHGSLRKPKEFLFARMMDVGVDAMRKITGSYRPMQWSEIKDALAHCEPTSVDHHEVETGPLRTGTYSV